MIKKTKKIFFQEIVAMVDFMYHGEVAVPNEDLNIFLETAALFKVTSIPLLRKFCFLAN